ncbi:MAG: glycosyltransferase, partial [Promethearchaeota archaeon]
MNSLNGQRQRIDQKLRILYFTPIFTLANTEIETYMTNEVNSVVDKFANVEFLVYFASFRKRNEIVKRSKRILQVNRSSYKNFLFIKDMVKIFTKFKPNIVHSHYVVPSIFVNIFAKIYRVPTILHGRGTDINYRPYQNIISKILLLVGSRLNNLILTVCKSMRDDVLKFKIPRDKVKVIYNGVDFETFNPKNKKFFKNQRPLELIHVGSLSYRKGQHQILEACKLLKEKEINFHLTLIGGGPQKQLITNLITEYKLESSVSLVGAIDH